MRDTAVFRFILVVSVIFQQNNTWAHPTKAIVVRSPVTKKIILGNKAIQWNRNITATILIQNCSREISIPLDCFAVKDYFLSNCDNRV